MNYFHYKTILEALHASLIKEKLELPKLPRGFPLAQQAKIHEIEDIIEDRINAERRVWSQIIQAYMPDL